MKIAYICQKRILCEYFITKLLVFILTAILPLSLLKQSSKVILLFYSRYSVRKTICHPQNYQVNVKHISITTNRLSLSEVPKETDGPKKILIPKRIERGVTDILKVSNLYFKNITIITI